MKLSEAIEYINSALNYPALTYIDISLYLDMAIAELNTTLHTSIPSVKFMVNEFRQNLSTPEDNKVILSADPSLTSFEITTDPTNPLTNQIPFYFSSSTKTFFILDTYNQEYNEFDSIKAVYVDTDGVHVYQSVSYGADAVWAEVPTDPTYECDLDKYLPDDWVLLWLIPYVCFKYTVRDGGTAQTFAEELTQGFQQLQETYNIPDKVFLATYADVPAYTSIVEDNLPNINIWVQTRAISERMKHARNVNVIYDNFYNRGGF